MVINTIKKRGLLLTGDCKMKGELRGNSPLKESMGDYEKAQMLSSTHAHKVKTAY